MIEAIDGLAAGKAYLHCGLLGKALHSWGAGGPTRLTRADGVVPSVTGDRTGTRADRDVRPYDQEVRCRLLMPKAGV